MEWLPSFDAALVWRAGPVLMLAWLAIFFGRTLRPGRMPLIERIARVSEPEMSLPLRRYTRGLTVLWCVYFAGAALLSMIVSSPWAGVAAGLGSAALFVGERWLRPCWFPGHAFPGLAQQLRDTWSVWHPRKPTLR